VDYNIEEDKLICSDCPEGSETYLNKFTTVSNANIKVSNGWHRFKSLFYIDTKCYIPTYNNTLINERCKNWTIPDNEIGLVSGKIEGAGRYYGEISFGIELLYDGNVKNTN